MRQSVWIAAVVAAACPLVSTAAPIPGTYTTGGDVTLNGNGSYTLTTTGANDFGVLRYVFNNPVPFNQLTNIAVSYTQADGGFGGGSPRIAVVLADNTFFNINIGPSPNFVDPAPTVPGSTGNLLNNDTGRFDLSPRGGSPFMNYAAALASVGSTPVVRLSLVLDTFAPFPERTFTVAGDGFAAADATAIPEPTTLAAVGLLAVGGMAVRRVRRSA